MAIYQTLNELDVNKARVKLEYFIKEGKVFEMKEKRFTRTLLQNNSMHLFFTMIATELNNMGREFVYEGLNVDSISVMYTDKIVKEFFWRPLQLTLFGIKSTTELDSNQMNKIIDVIVKFFGDKGVYVEFPNKDLMLKSMKNENEI